mgnify:CR=1 FL=1|jgi:pimeloyl-ACP methyl ester carboxylesterase
MYPLRHLQIKAFHLLLVLLFLILACSANTSPGGDAVEVSFNTQDDIVLNGYIFGEGNVGVILSHMETGDQSNWWPFARILRDKGYKVLTYDFRGFRKSSGDIALDFSHKDLSAAIDYFVDQNVSNIFLVGAGVGGVASLKLGSQPTISGVITLSSPPIFGTLDVVDDIPEIMAPKMFLAAEEDFFNVRSLDVFLQMSTGSKEKHIIKGIEQGTNMLFGSSGPSVKGLILDFLRRNTS